MTRTVFYAWQSDCPSGTNRGFIRDALTKAVRRLNQEGYDVAVDEGTEGVAGMPDISNEILKKIDQCAAFVADVTLVGTVDKTGSDKRMSNPSVMYELGFARKALGENRLVALVNTAFGRVEDLPFDIRSARVSTYTRNKRKGDEDTEPAQLSDLLYRSLKRVLDEFDCDESASAKMAPVAALKRLLPDANQVIEVEDLIVDYCESLVTALGDDERFPHTNSKVSADAPGIRYLADQAKLYMDVCSPFCELFATGVAFGSTIHDDVWRRVIERIGNIASQQQAGHVPLLHLRHLPTLMLGYATLIAGVHRNNYSAIRSVFIDATPRDGDGQKVPAIGSVHPWIPFTRVDLVATVASIDAEHDDVCDLDRIGDLICGAVGRRYTPGSDLLYTILREPLRPIIRDDETYTETFDQAEVLLALIAADAAANSDVYLPSPYYGAFTWRHRFEQPRFEQKFVDDALSAGREWLPLSAGLFGGYEARIRSAAETVLSGAKAARGRQH